MASEGRLLEALIEYFKDGGRPLQVVGVMQDAWDCALYEIKKQGAWELDKLHAARRV